MSTLLAFQPEYDEHALPPHLQGLSTDDLVMVAQKGDDNARDYLIRCHWDFVRRVASRVAKRSVQPDDDLWSVALIAFNEALDTYKEDGRASFRTFANTVISRRLIDRFRRRSRNRDLPLTYFEAETDEGDSYNPISIEEARRRFQVSEEGADLAREVEAYKEALTEYGVSLRELVDSSPSQQGARERAKEVADLLVQDAECRRYFIQRKKLPLKRLASMQDNPVSRQTMERNRAYIVALGVIKLGDFEHILTFVEG